MNADTIEIILKNLQTPDIDVNKMEHHIESARERFESFREPTLTIYNEHVDFYDAELTVAIRNTLGQDTANEDAVKTVLEMGKTYASRGSETTVHHAYGSCIPATVVYAGLLELWGEPSELFPHVVIDNDAPEGCVTKEHFVLCSRSGDIVDFTMAKHASGDFDIMPEDQAKTVAWGMLESKTLTARMSLILQRLEPIYGEKVLRYSGEDVLDAFKRVMKKGWENDIPSHAFHAQLQKRSI